MGRWRRLRQWRWVLLTSATALLLAAGGAPALAGTAHTAGRAALTARAAGSGGTPAWQRKYLKSLYCGGTASYLCVDINNRYAASAGHTPWYTGHDEPSALFYSNRPGSGNNNFYLLRLPRDPKTQPTQQTTGGQAPTWNFQLHPAFWFGMAMCDSQSYPEFSTTCQPDTNANIANSANPSSPQFIGKHAGTAFMEMQFYPPGWAPWPAGVSCDAHQWCAALNIDSYDANPAGAANNQACLNTVGVEPVNFAFITRNGKAQAPANPVAATAATYTPDPSKDLFMNPGDLLGVEMRDTGSGFQVVIRDFTSHKTGAMTASAGNGFGQVLYQPNSTTCNVAPYNFHPMYSTSSPATRVPWAAHSYNVAFADEIGHFEYCTRVKTTTGGCTVPGGEDTAYPDPSSTSDDFGCFAPSQSLLVSIGGCISTDGDFDGPEYDNNWPGTGNPNTPQPITFSSPSFNGGLQYSQVAFEADLPRIEVSAISTTNNCDRTSGAGCINPPNGPNGQPIPFYPIYTTSSHGLLGGHCAWQLGGASIPGTTHTFGGTSTAEYGPLLKLLYATSYTTATLRYNDFRQILSTNPC